MKACEVKLGQMIDGGRVTSRVDNMNGTFDICISYFDYEQREWEHYPMVFEANEEISL